MGEQDAKDINQMMAETSTTVVAPTQTKKSKFIWIVLGCVVIGVGLGIVVYQQSTAPKSTPKPSPRPVVVASPTPKASPSVIPSPSPMVATESAVPVEINVVQPVGATGSGIGGALSATPSATATASAVASPRVTMPDTSEGTPVTGVFELTVGAVSLGLILLVIGLVGLLAL